MSPLETVAVSVLWILVLVLLGLVLLLYRVVDQSYRGAAGSGRPLAPGTRWPDIEVVTQHGTEMMALSPDMNLVAFVQPRCSRCGQLLEALAADGTYPGHVYVLQAADVSREDRPPVIGARVQVLGLAHPPDVIRSVGAVSVPFVYLLRGRQVLAAGAVASRDEISNLLIQAQANAESLNAESRMSR